MLKKLVRPQLVRSVLKNYSVAKPVTDELDNHAFILSQYKESLAPALSHLTSFVADRGQGSWIYDDQNNLKYLDFTCGIGVTNTGHCHPRVVEAIREQAGKLIHGQMNILNHSPMAQLISKLKTQVMPNDSLDTFFFANSGSEAVESAIKLARHYTGRTNTIVFQGSFHGRTIGAMSLTTSKVGYRMGYQPLMPGVFVSPFPYCHHCSAKTHKCGDRINSKCCMGDPVKQLDLLFRQQTAPSETAAILIEPILGEGGYVPASSGFMKELRRICDQYGILLIVDEVQSGFGRTGKYFAFEHSDIVPDIVIMAKGIASGLPLSGIAGNSKVFSKSPMISMGGTYGGNAVACAAACATIDVIEEEKLLENTVHRGEQLRAGLLKLKQKYSVISDVRGEGLMLAIEFDADYGFAGKVSKAALDHKMLLLTTSVFETIRIIPPLTVSKEEIELGLTLLDKSIAAALKNK